MKLLISSLLAMALLDPDVIPPSGANGSGKVAPQAKPAKVSAAATFGGMSTPESVLYDAESDVYLVSNINGSPLAKDNNGFIAVLSPEKPDAPFTKLVEGGKNKVTLNAPKGMAILGGVLYVADIDTVRMFERKTGKPKGELKVLGATFLNDLAVSPDGSTVYFTDSGLKQGAKDFEPSGADAVYAIKQGKVAPVLQDKDLGRPNGLVATAESLWVVNFGNNELWPLDFKTGKKGTVTQLPKGGLDGLVMLSNGELLVSSWEGKAIYRGKPGGELKEWVNELNAPADIGYDSKRDRVLVPRFLDNRVEAYPVNASGS